MINMMHLFWPDPGDALLAVLLQIALFALASLAIIVSIMWVRVPVRRRKYRRDEKENGKNR